MKTIRFILLLLLIQLSALGQQTQWGTQLIARPNARSAQLYLQLTNVAPGSNVVFYTDYLGRIVINSTGGGGGGSSGTNGVNGTNGLSATVSVGSTTTGSAGSSAIVTNVGTSSAAILNFTIPRGDTGATGATGATGSNGTSGTNGVNPTVNVTNTITLDPGSSATVSNLGTATAAIFQFSIPRGDTGSGGGAAGTDYAMYTVNPYSFDTNFYIDYSKPAQRWYATNFALRYSTNWTGSSTSRIASIFIPQTNVLRHVYVYDDATNWNTIGIPAPMIIPVGYTAKITAQNFGGGETNNFVSFLLQNTPTYYAENTFNPASISGLVLWCDAAEGLYQSEYGTNPVTLTSQVIKYWNDKSGSGNSLTNAGNTNVFLSPFGAPNSLPAVAFGGGGTGKSWLISRTVNWVQPNYVFVVFWHTGNNAYVLGNENLRVFIDSGNSLTLQNGGNIVSYGTLAQSIWRVFSEYQPSSDTLVQTNGVDMGTQSVGTSPISVVSVGSFSDGATPLNCRIAEILIYNANLSGANYTNVTTYLKTKYGL